MSTKSYPRERSPLYELQSRRKLADLLRIDMTQLRRLTGRVHLYSHFAVAKNDGSKRIVDNPRDELKRVQGRIANFLARIVPSEILFCPVKGRSYIDNARQHRGHRVIHSLDVQKYLPNTKSQRVYWFFHSVMRCTLMSRRCSPESRAMMASADRQPSQSNPRLLRARRRVGESRAHREGQRLRRVDLD
jgi:hypothetical protein